MNAETAAKPVIVGVDGSGYSSALRYAGSLAARLGTRLEVRHGEGGLLKSPMASVTKAFAAHSTCRVLLVGQEADTV